MNEECMSFRTCNGWIIMWRYRNTPNDKWMWGTEELIDGEERVIQWWNDFLTAAQRFNLLLEKYTKEK